MAGATQVRASADDADRPIRGTAVLFELAGADGSQGASGAPSVPPAQAGPLLAGLQTLGRVIADEYRALLGALLIILVLLLLASTAAYFLERGAQPDKFGSIPDAAWWALATLTTVGYGDIVPVTPLGKLLGGVVMLLGVGMIALPVAIIATGFSQESNRHQFVVTWSMVARVPLFAAMDESEIAEITKLIYTRLFLPGVPIVRKGDAGDAMYLIARGEAVVEIAANLQAVLKEGDFFGEMALLERRRHKHDVVANTRCKVYVLDSQSLSRLARRHPEILQRIRAVAEARSAGEGWQRKPRAAAKRGKQDEPQTF